MRKRRLLTTDAVGGVWSYSLDLARAMAGAEDMVTLLAVLGPEPDAEQRSEATAIPGLQLISTGLPLDWTATDAIAVRDAAWALAQLAAQAEVELVQLHSPALATCPYPVPVVSVVHSCVATWWSQVRGGPLPPDLDWRAELVREGMQCSDLVIAPTRAFAEELKASYDLSAAPTVVHNGRRAGPTAGSAVPVDYAFTAGRLWDPGKNAGAFDQAAQTSRAPFLAAGPLRGPSGQEVRLTNARSVGTLSAEALANALARRPIFVSPALYEPFGLAVLEAAQAGCALILADRPGFRELWDGAAIFIDPLDPAAIAAAADGLVDDPVRRAELGEAALRRAAAYSPDAMARSLLRLTAPLLCVPQRARVAA